MAGEIIGTDTALKIAGWVVGGAAYGGSLIMYLKMQLKSHDARITNAEGAITDIQRAHALGVRPEDIKVLREDIKELRQLILSNRQ